MKIFWKKYKFLWILQVIVLLLVSVGTLLSGYYYGKMVQQIQTDAQNNSFNTGWSKFFIIFITLLGIQLYSFLISFIKGYIQSRIRFRIFSSVSLEVAQRFEQAKSTEIKKFSESKMWNYLFNDADIYFNENILNWISFLNKIFDIVMTIFVAALINSILIAAFLGVLVVSFFLSFTFQKKQKEAIINFSTAQEKLFDKLANLFEGYDRLYFANKTYVIKEQMQEQLYEMYLSELKKNYLEQFVKDGFITQVLYAIKLIATTLIIFAIFYTKLDVQSLIFFRFLFDIFLDSVPTMSMNLRKIKASKVVIEKLKLKHIILDTNTQIISNIEKLEFKNVNFSYDDKNNVLNNFNFVFEKNKKYALVGESGKGKSTILKIILGIEDNYTGSILWNNKELKTIKESSLRENVSFLDGSNFLFRDSVDNNIALWDKQLNKNKVKQMLEYFNLTKELKDFQQFNKENIVSLSEGQKQRITLARLMYTEPKFIILDEVFANLDKNNADNIKEKLLLDPNLTIIMVSHHLDAKDRKYFDQIIDFNTL
ncbi:ABC transporter ATP-binding protein [Mesomycoplasma hyorhinis]|uniref:ABC-type multidrug transport system, ATPase and permease component n=1 Tax=Mesomycoplasma hyorhinis (strain MCLD) TaxID=936139 RepID=A0ABM5M5U8_MESHM|nr:ABC transporter ATP-binding protein [Mesomycoplasma hyorhinis]AEC45820.1 ABC-type multidrug transport system, ATPase and permease component [Mesomycoplasma hyorhinis MCLD]AEX13953.1 ABC transporter, ATP-binding/permease protein [Mesomycoplasma hyorhinis GDL-1]AHA40920.1 ABC transporter ATP-binding permease [Mesomycoplasma hyorhinis DBS 1050]AOD25159.1 ABC transporter, ATP-binding/permease protein [Mesomycoplasma hyorhinis]MXR11803.1 ABC transporter ATP-binding protein [Mesomycoplasma hyorhi